MLRHTCTPILLGPVDHKQQMKPILTDDATQRDACQSEMTVLSGHPRALCEGPEEQLESRQQEIRFNQVLCSL